MNNPGYGFVPNDHRRVSKATVWVEQNQRSLFPPQQDRSPSQRGLTRVIVVDGAIGGAVTANQVQGDFSVDSNATQGIITKSIILPNRGLWAPPIMPPGIDYYVRCVVSPGGSSRTWQLSVFQPGGYLTPGTMTEPISETALASDVEDAINATGCPPCRVHGLGTQLVAPDGTLYDWPQRCWHIHWPWEGWILSTLRPDNSSPPVWTYTPGNGEVPIQLIPTAYRPAVFVNAISQLSLMVNSPMLPGSIAWCEPLTGIGLAVVNSECWSYND